MTLSIWLLLFHGLLAIALIGTVTHQGVASVRALNHAPEGFVGHYAAVNPGMFVNAVIVTYVATFILGSVIYPAYRLDVRIALAEMQLGWGIGLFELKEHWAALGLGLLPLYNHLWKHPSPDTQGRGRATVTLILAVIVWFNLLVGHVLNNFRGL